MRSFLGLSRKSVPYGQLVTFILLGASWFCSVRKSFYMLTHTQIDFFFFFSIRNGHMLTHRNKKPYECKAEGCGKSYCDARSLRRHTENHHSTVATTPTTPTQSISSTGPLGGLSLSPATASGKLSVYLFL